eukprot:427008-Alexandrium_andersonii.AAC.1
MAPVLEEREVGSGVDDPGGRACAGATQALVEVDHLDRRPELEQDRLLEVEGGAAQGQAGATGLERGSRWRSRPR